MSSAIYLTFKEPANRVLWDLFAEAKKIVYSPNTIGRNVYYQGNVEIHFGEPNYELLPTLPNGQLDFGAARPNPEAGQLSVQTYFGGDVDAVRRVARSILRRFPATWESDTECSLEGEGWERTPEDVRIVFGFDS